VPPTPANHRIKNQPSPFEPSKTLTTFLFSMEVLPAVLHRQIQNGHGFALVIAGITASDLALKDAILHRVVHKNDGQNDGSAHEREKLTGGAR
jgi:hypothetical protein